MRRRHGAVCGSRIERVQASLQGVWAGPRPKSACRPSSGLFTCPVRVQTAEWLPPPATDHQSCAWPVFSERRSDPISPPIEMRLSSRPPPPSRSDLPPSRRRGRTRCSVHSVGEVRVRSSPLPKRPLPPSPQLNRRVDPRLELCTTAREWYAPAANRRGRRVSWGSSEGIASAGGHRRGSRQLGMVGRPRRQDDAFGRWWLYVSKVGHRDSNQPQPLP